MTRREGPEPVRPTSAEERSVRTDDSIRNLGERDIDGGLQKAKFKWNGDAGRRGKRGCHHRGPGHTISKGRAGH